MTDEHHAQSLLHPSSTSVDKPATLRCWENHRDASPPVRTPVAPIVFQLGRMGSSMPQLERKSSVWNSAARRRAGWRTNGLRSGRNRKPESSRF